MKRGKISLCKSVISFWMTVKRNLYHYFKNTNTKWSNGLLKKGRKKENEKREKMEKECLKQKKRKIFQETNDVAHKVFTM